MILSTEKQLERTGASHLCAKHYRELIERRGLDAQWIEANCCSVNADEATQRLGYRAKGAGILLEGVGIQTQFKPDRPWKNEGEKKAPKYRSPLGDYDAMLPIHPNDKAYWDDLEALKAKCYRVQGHPCLVLTEGFFKALAGCSNGIPTLALLGVEMGLTPKNADIEGRRYVVPTLKKLANAGFGFIIAFDADCTTNKAVLWAQRKLAEQLLKFKVPVYSATGLWSVEQGKGMDDYIQSNGADKFKHEVLGKVISHQEWLKSLEQQFPPEVDSNKKEKIPPADLIGKSIAQEYRDRLLWNDEHKTWMEYSLERKGVWSPVSDLFVQAAVDTILEAKGITGYGSASYITNVVAKMKLKLFTEKWGERSLELLPFADGVFELATSKFVPHSPGHRLTWCLPRHYNSVASDWNTINDWLDEVTENNKRNKELLLCFAAAILRGRADLQKFLHLIGVGGTGKSSFTRLLEALIGSKNCFVGSLQELTDKHIVVELLGKRLALFPDQDAKGVKNLSTFKRMTGEDTLNGRRLYKDPASFRFAGLAVVTSNGPIFHANGGSWLTRRIIMLAFDRKPNKVRNLEKEFEPELPAFTNHLLSISEEEITRVLRGLGKGDIQKPLWESQIRTDSIAAWLNECIIYDKPAKTLIGSNKSEWWSNDRDYDPHISTLFGSYSLYCRNTGLQAKGKNNFSSDLIELCQQTLGWKIEYCRGSNGQRMIQGLRLRTPDDPDPTLEDTLTFHTDNPSDNPDNPSDNPSDNLKPLQNIDSDNPDNQSDQNFSQINHSNLAQAGGEISAEIECDASTEKDLPKPVVSLAESSINQASQVVSQVVSRLSVGLSEPDYDSYPHLTSNSIEGKRNQSQKIKQRLLEATSREELTAIEQEFSDRFHWVWSNLLTDAERGKLRAIANVEQLNLLSLAQDEKTVGEKVAQPCLINRRVQVFENRYITPGVGVVEVDRGNGCIEVRMETGKIQVINKDYQLLDEEVH